MQAIASNRFEKDFVELIGFANFAAKVTNFAKR